MEVKKVAFLDIARGEQGEDPDSEDERFESDFVLMAGLLSKFLADLMEALGGEKKSPL
jgi:recombination associated protein RdgC